MFFSEWTNQIELPVFSQRISRPDFNLCGHKMVKQYQHPKQFTGNFWDGNWLDKNANELFGAHYKKFEAQ